MPPKTSSEFAKLHIRNLKNESLRGDSGVRKIPHIGEYFESIMHSQGIFTVSDLVGHITELKTAKSSYDRLTRLLQNRRSGQALSFRNSPIVSEPERGKTVVGDFNKYAYLSIRALMVALSGMRAPQRRSYGFDASVPKRSVPQAYPRVSAGGKYCTSHHADEDSCRETKNHCRWVEPRGRQTPGHCVPRSSRTGSTPGVGANVPRSRSRAGSAPKYDGQTTAQKRGRYVESWRIPGELREMTRR